MNEDIDLTNKLRRVAAALPREASPHVEQKLAAAFRVRVRPVPKRSLWLVATAAACVAVAVFMHTRQTAIDNSAKFVYTAPGFVALPYAQSGVPLESVVVMRVQMRSAELGSLGVAAPAAAGSAEITADLLVGQDGVPRAVRFVQ